MPEHPVLAGGLAGSMEILVTYPLEYVKTQLQLQQQASALHAGSKRYLGAVDCFARTVTESGPLALYRGGASWILFAGPRSAVRFGTFEFLASAAKRNGFEGSAVATANGLIAGVVEAAVCQVPNQNIAIKMVHDSAPAGPKRYRSMLHATRLIYHEHGVQAGFFGGFVPGVVKGAVTNCVRFPVYALISDAMKQRNAPEQPLSVSQSMLAGGIAGVISAVISQPIDTIKANMMGLEADTFNSTWGCTTQLVRAGGVRALFNGVGPRAARVFIEVGLQFTLFGAISRRLDALLANK